VHVSARDLTRSPLIRAPGHDRARSLGWLCAAWVEHFCVHGPGDVQGDRVELDDEFAGFAVDAYAVGPSGRRLYDAAFLSRPKGRAKSELAGFFTLWEAFGPCRFAGWADGGELFRWRDFRYVYEPGEPLGRSVTHPFIRCLATEESQAGNTYDNVHFNLTDGPLSEGLPRDAAGLTRVLLPGGGEIVPSTASNAAKDGGKETFAVFDETHLYVTPELRRMYATVRRNLAKRKLAEPWALQTSTMYRVDQDSVAKGTHERALAARDGRVREHRLLFDHVEAPAGVDLSSRAEIVAALRGVYGPAAAWLDLDGMVDREFWNVEADVDDSRRYFFNQPTAPRDAWVTAQELRPNRQDGHVLEDGATVVLFFDGSKSDDATGLVAVRMDDGAAFTLGLWERPERVDAWEVDRADVDLTVRAAHDRFDVAAFFADVAHFESYIDAWAAELGGGYVVDAVAGKARHRVAWDMRGHVREFTEAAGRHLVDVREGVAPFVGADLERHTLHARRAPNRFGVSIAKDGRESPHKIDLAVCWVGARMVRRLVLASPAWVKRSRPRSGRVVGF
jgi:hypothetical protein